MRICSARRKLMRQRWCSVHYPVLAAGATRIYEGGSRTEVPVLTDTGIIIIAAGDAAWSTSLELRDTADLPSAEYLADNTRLVPEEGERVEVIGDKDVAGVKVRRSPQHAGVVCIRHHITLVRA